MDGMSIAFPDAGWTIDLNQVCSTAVVALDVTVLALRLIYRISRLLGSQPCKRGNAYALCPEDYGRT